MGARGNIAIKQSGDVRIYFYTHWRGSELPKILRDALGRGKNRWDDPAYLARMIFDEMTSGEKGETGFGISTEVQDNEYPILVVNPDERVITIDGIGSGPNVLALGVAPKHSWTFAEFAALPENIQWDHMKV